MKKTAILLLFLLCSCSVNPAMKKPSVPKAHAYAARDELVSMNSKIVLGNRIASDWWALFSSKPLNDLIRLAIGNNYDLAAARETLKAAEAAANAERAALLPRVSLDAAAGRQKYGAALFGPANFSIPPFNYYEIGPSISWTPDIFGRAHHAVEFRKALADYQVHQLDAAYLFLTGNTVAQTLEMAAACDEIKTARRILSEDEKTLELTKEAHEIGSASEKGVLRAQARLTSDRSMLPPIEHRLSASRHALAILLGKMPANWHPPGIGLGDFTMPKALSLSLPSELARRRPDILAAEANLNAARATIGAANANLYPSLTLTANMMQEALTPAGIFSSAGTAWALAAGISAPVFDGGRLSAEKEEAGHAYRAALARYRQTILNAFGEVADALTSLAHDEEAVETAKSSVETAGNTLNLALLSYRAGSVGQLQVHDAWRTLEIMRLDLLRLEHLRYLDCVRLFVALGGSPLSGKA